MGVGDGVVDTVVDVKGTHIGTADAVAAHIRLVGDNERGRNIVHRTAGGFIVVGYRRHHRHAVNEGQVGLGEDVPRQQRTVLGVMLTIDGVADVVEESCHLHQLLPMLVVAESRQNLGCTLGNQGAVSRGMVGIAQHAENVVAPLDKGAHLFIVSQFFVGHRTPPCFLALFYQIPRLGTR